MPSTSSQVTSMATFTATAVAGVAAGIVASKLLSSWVVGKGSFNSDGFDSISKGIPAELLNSPYGEELKLAIQLAGKAGRNMLGYVECRGTIDEARYQLQEEMMEIKSSEADFCTHVDIENEKLVMEGIQHQFPTHKIIGEESVGTGTVPPLTKERTWIIDPIDGTTNFSQGINLTCVSIGLCDNGKPVMGVVYAPATNELFYAVTSLGSYRNGRRITQRLTDKKLQKAVICCEFGYSRREKEIDAMLGVVKDILQHGCRAIRQFGSGVLDLCYVATGKLDIVYAGVANEGWKPWDYCAGKVICDEAGCIMENFDQQPDDDFDLYGKSIICGINRHLVDECRKLVLKHQI